MSPIPVGLKDQRITAVVALSPKKAETSLVSVSVPLVLIDHERTAGLDVSVLPDAADLDPPRMLCPSTIPGVPADCSPHLAAMTLSGQKRDQSSSRGRGRISQGCAPGKTWAVWRQDGSCDDGRDDHQSAE